MTKFADLLAQTNPPTHPAELQRRAEERFPEVVRQSPLRLLDSSSLGEWKAREDGVTLAVATFSLKDLQLLDWLVDLLAAREDHLPVNVFNSANFLVALPKKTRLVTTPYLRICGRPGGPEEVRGDLDVRAKLKSLFGVKELA